MSDQALRLLEILRAIPREGKISTSELKRRLEEAGFAITNPRMVQRDLEQLLLHFPLVCDERSKPYGWSWSVGAVAMTLPGLSEAEALSFHLVERHLKGLLPASTTTDLQPYFRAAREKLAASAGRSPLGSWSHRIRVVAPQQPLLAPKVSRAVRHTVTTALLRGRQLEITYAAPWASAPKKHRIHPLGLVQHGPASYLCVRYYNYPTVRIIALHRIRAATLLDQPVQPPPGFDLDRWIESGAFGFGKHGDPIRLDIEFRQHAGDFLLETPLAEDQKASQDGDVLRIQATVANTERLRWWILSFGSSATVRDPPELRDAIVAELRAAAAAYGTVGTPTEDVHSAPEQGVTHCSPNPG